MCNVEYHVFLFTELEVLLAMVGAAATRLKQRLDLIYVNRSDDNGRNFSGAHCAADVLCSKVDFQSVEEKCHR